MACEAKSYHGLTPPMMEAIRMDLLKMGMTMCESYVGKVNYDAFGVEAEFEYHETDRVLHVKVSQKPFFVPCSMIYGKMDQTISRHQSGHDPMDGR
jgi:hypothetical protein